MEGKMKEYEKLENLLDIFSKNDVDSEEITNGLLGSIASSLAIIADVMAERRTDETCGDN